jgi:hypothetical protein
MKHQVRRRIVADRPTALLAVLAIVAIAALASVLARWTSGSAIARLAATVVVLYWLPGRVLVASLGLRAAPLESAVVSTLAGIAASCIVFWVGSALGWPGVLWVWPLCAAAFGLALYRRGRLTLPRADVTLRPEHALLALLVVVAVVPLAFLAYYWPNLAPGDDGSMSFVRVRDAVFHLSMAQELGNSIPPETPGFSSEPLAYHYGMALVAAALSRFAGLGVPDVTLRFEPALFLALTVVAGFTVARRWLGHGLAALLVAALVVFAEDLAYVPALLIGEYDPVWSAYFFQVPTVFSLYFFNGMLPGLAFLLAALLCLFRYAETRQRAWAAMFGFLGAAVVSFKVFTAAHLAAALVVAAAVLLVTRRRTLLVAPFLFLVAFLVPFSLPAYAVPGTEGNPNAVRLELAPYLGQFLDAIASRPLDPGGSKLLAIAVIPLFLAGTLGMRWLALPALVSRRSQLARPVELRIFLGVFVVLGIVITLFTTVRPVDAGAYTNSVWFLVVAKYVVWLLALETVVAWWERGRHRTAVVAAVAAGVLSVPATVQFFAVVEDSPSNYLVRELPSKIDADRLRLVEALDARCGDGDVVLAPDPVLVSTLSLTGCRTPYFDLFLAGLLPADAVAARARDVASFWSDWRSGGCRADVLARYRVRYVVAARDSRQPCGDALRRSFASGGYLLFEAKPGAPPQ